MRISLALFALSPLALAASLSDYGGPSVPSNLPAKCKATYEGTIPGCSDNELRSKQCGVACQGGLKFLAVNLTLNCRGIQGPNIITVFMAGDGTKTVCSNVEGAIPQVNPSSSSTRSSSTSAAASTSARAASTTSSSASSTSSSSSTTSSTSSAASSTSISQSTSSQTPTSTPTANSRPAGFSSGGGSPFDLDATSGASIHYRNLLGSTVAVLLSGLALVAL